MISVSSGFFCGNAERFDRTSFTNADSRPSLRPSHSSRLPYAVEINGIPGMEAATRGSRVRRRGVLHDERGHGA